MKKTFSILVLLISLSSYSQTKKETLDWLNKSFAEFYFNAWGNHYEITTVTDEHANEVIAISIKFQNDTNRMDYLIDPKEISRISTSRKLSTDKINGRLCLEIYSQNFGIYNKDKSLDSFLIGLDTTNENIAKIQRGLKHLVKLIGYEIPEEKDLFGK
jgi:hypothetical protein